MHEGQQAGRRGGKSKVTVTARRVGRRSCGVKAAVRRDELGGASMQPSMATLPGKLLHQPRNLVIVKLILSPILFIAGIHFPHCRNIVINFLLPVFPNQGLDCFVLESSRVFFVKFLKLSVFQIDELLHFIDFRRKFIKMQNQCCLKP
jgi:hypothetical protein